jgi:hypothetical protein
MCTWRGRPPLTAVGQAGWLTSAGGGAGGGALRQACRSPASGLQLLGWHGGAKSAAAALQQDTVLHCMH